MNKTFVDEVFDAGLKELQDIYSQKERLGLNLTNNSNIDFKSSANKNAFKNQKEFEREKLKLNVREESIISSMDHILGTLNSSKSFLISSLNILVSSMNNPSITKIIAKESGRSCYHVAKSISRRPKPNRSYSISVVPMALSFTENDNAFHENSDKYICIGNHYCSCPSFSSSVYFGVSDSNLSYGERRFKCIHLLAILIAETLSVDQKDSKQKKYLDDIKEKCDLMKTIIVRDEKFADYLLLNFPHNPYTSFDIKMRSSYQDEIERNEADDNEMDQV